MIWHPLTVFLSWLAYFAMHSLLAAGAVKKWTEKNAPVLYRYYRLIYNVVATGLLIWLSLWLVRSEQVLLFEPPLWLRVNGMRTTVSEYAALLQAEPGLASTTLAGAALALKLETAVATGRLPGFAAGLVTVQDAASQLAARLLDPQPGMRVLDACAAPGGKSTHLLEYAAGRIELTALDVSAERLPLVQSNLTRLGLTAQLIAGDATTPEQWWDGRPYDRILVDVGTHVGRIELALDRARVESHHLGCYCWYPRPRIESLLSPHRAGRGGANRQRYGQRRHWCGIYAG